VARIHAPMGGWDLSPQTASLPPSNSWHVGWIRTGLVNNLSSVNAARPTGSMRARVPSAEPADDMSG